LKRLRPRSKPSVGYDFGGQFGIGAGNDADSQQLNSEVAQTTDAQHCNKVTGHRPAVPQYVVSGNSGAERRGCFDVPGQGVELLDFEQVAPDPAAQFRLREVLEDELGLEDAPEIPIGAVETVVALYLNRRLWPFTALNPKFRVKSVHELSAVVYDSSTTITAFKSWIAWERSLSWQWLDKQTRSLLPISYYHCVFGLLIVTWAGGGPFAAGCWLLQPASQRLNATTISRSLPMRSIVLVALVCRLAEGNGEFSGELICLIYR